MKDFAKRQWYRFWASLLVPVYVLGHLLIVALSALYGAYHGAASGLADVEIVEGYRMYWRAMKKGGPA